MANILVVAPHADDEVLGCGGAIKRHAERGDDVYVHIVANRVYNHVVDEGYVQRMLEQADAAAAILGARRVFFSNLRDEQLDHLLIDIITAVEGTVSQVQPDVAYVPNATDTDQDHRATAQACLVACRGVRRVLAYEVPGPSVNFEPNCFLDISSVYEAKLQALAKYSEEMRPYPHPRSALAIEALARVRGVAAGLEMAEGFRILKEVLI